jgi:hypothetical protein
MTLLFMAKWNFFKKNNLTL